MIYRNSLLVLSLLLVAACAEPTPPPPPPIPVTTAQTSNSEVLFIGISVVDDQNVWISGTAGSFGRTVDGGVTWQIGTVPGADSLQFRDVHAVDAQTAYLLSIGNGEDSRIYKTTDAGISWTQQFTNAEADGFFDCMDFWDENNGIAFSDSFEGAFYIIKTSDGGDTWTRVSPAVLPPALDGEGSFAASGTCLMVKGENTVNIVTGAGGKSRVLTSTDRGLSWDVVETPVAHGTPSSGLASISYLDDSQGVVAGGEIAKPDSTADSIARTLDGGATWEVTGHTTFTGAVYGISYVPNQSTPTLVAAGPKGLDYSQDNGDTWNSLSTDNYWSVAFAPSGKGWATGTEGKVLHISF
ncbi:MAG: glycosyl hydrolase [Bacteroidota bacterium]